MQQVWFPGFHSDIGGQSGDRRISEFPLRWMLRQAAANGLVLAQGWSDALRPYANGDLRPPPAVLHCPGFTEPREIPPDSWIHESVFHRRDNQWNNYDPQHLPERYRVVRD